MKIIPLITPKQHRELAKVSAQTLEAFETQVEEGCIQDLADIDSLTRNAVTYLDIWHKTLSPQNLTGEVLASNFFLNGLFEAKNRVPRSHVRSQISARAKAVSNATPENLPDVVDALRVNHSALKNSHHYSIFLQHTDAISKSGMSPAEALLTISMLAYRTVIEAQAETTSELLASLPQFYKSADQEWNDHRAETKRRHVYFYPNVFRLSDKLTEKHASPFETNLLLADLAYAAGQGVPQHYSMASLSIAAEDSSKNDALIAQKIKWARSVSNLYRPRNKAELEQNLEVTLYKNTASAQVKALKEANVPKEKRPGALVLGAYRTFYGDLR